MSRRSSETNLSVPEHGAGVELLPCPFCGAPGQWASKVFSEVWCKSGDCPLHLRLFSLKDWNRRAADGAVGQWRPIDSLPHDCGAFLAVNSNGCQAVLNMVSATGIGYFIDDDGAHARLSEITHWQPLPLSPAVPSTKGEKP